MAKQKPSLTNQLIPELPVAIDPPQPTQGYSGIYKHVNSGLLYELCIIENDIRGRTHKARVPAQVDAAGNVVHNGLFWEGDAVEFRATFEKQ